MEIPNRSGIGGRARDKTIPGGPTTRFIELLWRARAQGKSDGDKMIADESIYFMNVISRYRTLGEISVRMCSRLSIYEGAAE